MLLISAGCSAPDREREPEVSPSNSASSDPAKTAWNDANSLAEATQDLVGGSWLGSDSAAEPCGESGVRWGLTRLGPGTEPGVRAKVLTAVEELWTRAGYVPTGKQFGGDAPGAELRYPRTGTKEDGYFIEFRTTVNGTTIAMQTPCTIGDVEDLNREKYAERHTTTPPDIPGASTSATPTDGATP